MAPIWTSPSRRVNMRAYEFVWRVHLREVYEFIMPKRSRVRNRRLRHGECECSHRALKQHHKGAVHVQQTVGMAFAIRIVRVIADMCVCVCVCVCVCTFTSVIRGLEQITGIFPLNGPTTGTGKLTIFGTSFSVFAVSAALPITYLIAV